MDFINRIINTVDRQTDNSMVGSQKRIQVPHARYECLLNLSEDGGGCAAQACSQVLPEAGMEGKETVWPPPTFDVTSLPWKSVS